MPTTWDALVDAVDRRDLAAVSAGLTAGYDALGDAGPDELTAALARLAPVLDRNCGIGGHVAHLAGAMVDPGGADPRPLLGPLVPQLTELLTSAGLFPVLWEILTEGGPLPSPDDPEAIPVSMRQIDAGAWRLPDVPRTAMYESADAWLASGSWLSLALGLLQRRDVRAALPDRASLLAAAEEAGEQVEGVEWLVGLLRVLDDEPLVVLHRETRRGYRLTASGIGGNFQLDTLLAHTLAGDPTAGLLPLPALDPAWLAAATDGEVHPPEPVEGRFLLVDAAGDRIWYEGAPADIPLLEGRRVVVLDPRPFPHQWNIGRTYPLMRPELRLAEVLTEAESGWWLDRVAPSRALTG